MTEPFGAGTWFKQPRHRKLGAASITKGAHATSATLLMPTGHWVAPRLSPLLQLLALSA